MAKYGWVDARVVVCDNVPTKVCGYSDTWELPSYGPGRGRTRNQEMRSLKKKPLFLWSYFHNNLPEQHMVWVHFEIFVGLLCIIVLA